MKSSSLQIFYNYQQPKKAYSTFYFQDDTQLDYVIQLHSKQSSKERAFVRCGSHPIIQWTRISFPQAQTFIFLTTDRALHKPSQSQFLSIKEFFKFRQL